MNPYYALPWILFFTAPFIEPNIYADAIARSLFVLASSLFAAAIYHQQHDDYTNGWCWFFLLLLLFPGIILLIEQAAQAPWFVWRQSLYFTGVWLLFTMLRSKQVNPASWMIPLVIFAHLYVIYALIEAFHLQWFNNNEIFLFWSDKTAHFPGPLRQQNQQALFLVIAITLIWRQACAFPQRWYWRALTLLPMTGLFLTASRSGLIVLILAAILVWAFNHFNKKNLWMLIYTSALGIFISMIILAIIPAQYSGGVMDHIQHELTDNAPSIRMMVWNICIHLWLQHPWLGIGWGNLAAHMFDTAAPVMVSHPEFASIASNLSGGVTQAHNIILQFLVEGGIIAASALLIMFTALGRQAQQWWSNPPPPTSHAVSGWICALVILAHGMVSVTVMEPFFMVILAMSLAACFSKNNNAH